MNSSTKVYKTLIKAQAIVSDFSSHWTVEPFLLGTRNRFNLMDLRATVQSIIMTAKVIKHTLGIGKNILIINTDQYNTPVVKAFQTSLAETNYSNSFSFVNTKWIGGTLTNWAGLSKKVTRFKRFTQYVDSLVTEKQIPLTELENLKKSYDGFSVNGKTLSCSVDSETTSISKVLNCFQEPKAKGRASLQIKSTSPEAFGHLKSEAFWNSLAREAAPRENTKKSFRLAFKPRFKPGIRKRSKLWSTRGLQPVALHSKEKNQSSSISSLENLNLGLVIVLNANSNQHAIREAFQLNIPVAAIVESNTDCQNITYPVFGNAGSPKFIQFFFNFVAKAIVHKPGCTKITQKPVAEASTAPLKKSVAF